MQEKNIGGLIFWKSKESRFLLDPLQSKKWITNILRCSSYSEKFLDMKLQVKFGADDLHRTYCSIGIFERICCFDEVFLMALALEIWYISQENTCGKFLFFNKIAGWGNCFWSFSCLLFKISCLFHFNRKMGWSSNIYFFARVSTCLTSKSSKELWQMVIWSENVFKGNLMLQFSWLEEFRLRKVSEWWTLNELKYKSGLKDQL